MLDVAEIAPVTLACDLAGLPLAGNIPANTSSFTEYPGLLPPQTLGAFGIIPNKAGNLPPWLKYELTALPKRQQHLYTECQEDLGALATREPGSSDWTERWDRLHQRYLKLARAYLRLHHSRAGTGAPPVVNIYTGGEGWGPITMPVYSVVAAIQNAASGGPQWEPGDRPPFTHRYPSGQTTLFLQKPKPASRSLQQSQPPGAGQKALAPAVTTLSDTTVKSLWDQVGKMRDLDADLLLMLLAQHATAPHLPDGTVWMTIEMALWVRGIQPKTHKDAGSHRFAGFLEEEKLPYREGIERLDLMWISISQRQRGKKLLTLESKLFDFRERWTQQTLFEGTEPQVGAVRFLPGTWLDELLMQGEAGKQFGRYLQKVFQYDLRKTWTKRLARYFTFHLRIAARLGSHTIQPTVGELLKECSLIENEDYAERYPQSMRNQFGLSVRS